MAPRMIERVRDDCIRVRMTRWGKVYTFLPVGCCGDDVAKDLGLTGGAFVRSER